MLSKVDIFDIRNNGESTKTCSITVVNCSQKLISLIFGTTERKNSRITAGCELLSKVDIFDIRNNHKLIGDNQIKVVNCSQKLISLIFGTTILPLIYFQSQLWIALKSWYLWYSEQLTLMEQDWKLRCELLSKVDIFDIRNNLFRVKIAPGGVVNCSQKLISLIFGTTHLCWTCEAVVLWIALKSWYLWYSEQQNGGVIPPISGCELLSKVDIFDIRNNPLTWNYLDWWVVNCSQKLISLIFGTTNRLKSNSYG